MRAMPKMVKLVQADLQQWQVTPDGAKAIAESLKMRPDYEQIRVSVDRPEIVIAALDVSYLGGTYPKVLGDAVAAAI